jgi:hypothetical protein
MNQIREFLFPVVVLGSWVVVAAYTLSSLGETPARVQKAQMAQRAPVLETVTAPAPQASLASRKAQKKMARRGPRA